MQYPVEPRRHLPMHANAETRFSTPRSSKLPDASSTAQGSGIKSLFPLAFSMRITPWRKCVKKKEKGNINDRVMEGDRVTQRC